MIRARICGAATNRIRVRGRTIAVVMGIGSLLISASTTAQNPPTTIIYRVTTAADLIDDNIADGVCHTSENTCSLRAAVIQANRLATVNRTSI
ncbi:MAG TPA: hypothetical protein PK001_11290 [Dokdonella sp.]|uniref:hypothetical protein n=1 Tax=Dokdonella sp. TaxID=2291710 RepID=UPI002B8B3C94|nr:hypothetical protein [Dokdonella sp.]HOX72312.1 hypothetical protein [Dokdonella sp.]